MGLGERERRGLCCEWGLGLDCRRRKQAAERTGERRAANSARGEGGVSAKMRDPVRPVDRPDPARCVARSLPLGRPLSLCRRLGQAAWSANTMLAGGQADGRTHEPVEFGLDYMLAKGGAQF